MKRPTDAARAVDLFAITPGRGDRDELLRVLPRLRAGGIERVVLREKQLEPRARAQLAETVAARCREIGLQLWIAEEFELARSIGAAGVQLSERSPSPLRVRDAVRGELALGISLHAPLTRTRAELAACAHAFIAPLFATPSKSGTAPLGVAGFLALARQIVLPCYALGGIGFAELPALAQAGIARVAAIRLFFDAVDPKAAAERARALLA